MPAEYAAVQSSKQPTVQVSLDAAIGAAEQNAKLAAHYPSVGKAYVEANDATVFASVDPAHLAALLAAVQSADGASVHGSDMSAQQTAVVSTLDRSEQLPDDAADDTAHLCSFKETHRAAVILSQQKSVRTTNPNAIVSANITA